MTELREITLSSEQRAAFALEALAENLGDIAELVGDDPLLIRMKAERAFAMLREIADGHVDAVIDPEFPQGLTPEQSAAVHALIGRACGACVTAAKEAAIHAILRHVIELCTSKLRPARERLED